MIQNNPSTQVTTMIARVVALWIIILTAIKKSLTFILPLLTVLIPTGLLPAGLLRTFMTHLQFTRTTTGLTMDMIPLQITMGTQHITGIIGHRDHPHYPMPMTDMATGGIIKNNMFHMAGIVIITVVIPGIGIITGHVAQNPRIALS